MAAEPRLGTRIREARERLRWSQDQLADAAGVSRSAVNAWENNRGRPRNMTVLKDVLGVSLEEDAPARTISPEFRAEIMAILDDPEDQRRVIGLLEGTVTWPSEPAADGPEERRRSGG